MEYTETEGRTDPWAVFGLENPNKKAQDAGNGAKEQDPANPAAGGEKEQEPANPAQVEGRAGREAHQDEDPDQDGKPAEKATQSKEERAENARRRRQQEMDEAVAAARKDERDKANQEFNKFLKAAKIENPHNGNKVIENLEEAMSWMDADKQARLQRDLKAGRLTPEALQAALEETPTFQALQQQVQATQQQSQAARNAEMQQKVDADLAEIAKLNPKITKVEDILDMPTKDQFIRCVNAGMSFLDAYRSANLDTLMAQERAAAQAGANLPKGGKDHLRHEGARGTDPQEMPAGAMRQYHKFFPGKSDAEIRAMYAKVK